MKFKSATQISHEPYEAVIVIGNVALDRINKHKAKVIWCIWGRKEIAATLDLMNLVSQGCDLNLARICILSGLDHILIHELGCLCVRLKLVFPLAHGATKRKVTENTKEQLLKWVYAMISIVICCFKRCVRLYIVV